MASELYNIIEGVSREKGIDPQIVVSAVEDAIVVATRKYYKSQENLRAVLDKESGKINAYAVKAIVENPEQIEDPNLQVTVDQARKLDPNAEAGGELLIPKVTEGILGRIAAQLAKQVIFQKVHRPCERSGECDREAHRGSGCDSRYRQGRSAHGTQGAIAPGVVRRGRAGARGDRARRKGFQGTGRCGFARRAGAGTASVPDRSSRNL